MKQKFGILSINLVWLILFGFTSVQAAPAGGVLFILDGSGSMWGQVEGKHKIVIAKEVMTKLVEELPEQINTGLQVYGHRSKGDCNDIELMVPLGAGNRRPLIQQINSIKPKGKTPITKAFEHAIEQLRAVEEETTVVLVSDGKETCEGDPCVLVRELREQGIRLKVHVVGFDVTHDESEQLVCIAEAGGGRYFSAQNADQLHKALTAVKQEVVAKAEKAKPENEYRDNQGHRVQMALGQKSFADKVVSFAEGKPPSTVQDSRNPQHALGSPDYVKGGAEESTTLGCGGTLIVQFTDNALVDLEGPDLHIFEVGGDVEPTTLDISKDGQTWIALGSVSGGKASVDISGVAKPDDVFYYVRLRDLKKRCDGNYPGADIDAVAAINSIAVD